MFEFDNCTLIVKNSTLVTDRITETWVSDFWKFVLVEKWFEGKLNKALFVIFCQIDDFSKWSTQRVAARLWKIIKYTTNLAKKNMLKKNFSETQFLADSGYPAFRFRAPDPSLAPMIYSENKIGEVDHYAGDRASLAQRPSLHDCGINFQPPLFWTVRFRSQFLNNIVVTLSKGNAFSQKVLMTWRFSQLELKPCKKIYALSHIMF